MIEVSSLVKRYGDHTAVDHLSFTVEEGQITGFLGTQLGGKIYNHEHNYRVSGPPGEGRVVIDGHDILEEPEEAKNVLGISRSFRLCIRK